MSHGRYAKQVNKVAVEATREDKMVLLSRESSRPQCIARARQ